MTDSSVPSTNDYRRKWHVFFALGTGVFLATVDGSIINVSLPTLARAFETDFSVVQWVVLAYLLTLTSTLLSFGRAGDIFGKKRVYLLGYIIFLAASVLCGLSISIQWLIAFRILQALGAAMMIALGAGILTEAFPPQERGKAMGMIGAIVSVSIAIGPALGGLLISSISWRWIFYVNLPVGLVGIPMVIRFLPDTRPDGHQSFDYWGALMLFAGLLSLLLSLTFGQRIGFSRTSVLILFGCFVALMVGFVVLEQRLDQPMIDMKLFGNPLFSISMATGFICFVSLSGVLILMPFYLENILQIKTLHVGLLMGIVPVMLGLSAPLSGLLSDRIGSRHIAVVGLLVLLVGYAVAASLSAQTSAVGYMARMFALGLGMGIFISPNNSAIMGSAPRHQLGVVSGLMAITRTLGQTVGVAVLGAVWVGRAAHHASAVGRFQDGTALPVHAQILALNDTFWIAAVLILVALVLGIWALVSVLRRSDEISGLPENEARPIVQPDQR